ncbi:MAG: rRNA maturation RNase YbeY [Marinobacter sp.]|uniref:rRNA maturation RNase YbeY n=1 Tax=Marinobacter sp. TaxID=50741 RepID=UPI00299E4318|nr:rRNA maturation RNase YbeY [Marinobacter sp.]MDX1635671.1 rRNA maturation RNase YbeY [Marinobacter sp.]
MSGLAVDIQRVVDDADLPTDAEFERWANLAWQAEEPSEVTLRIVDREESAELNGLYRHKTGPTNVLSFPFEAPPGITVPLAGDLVICAPVVRDEAHEQGKSLSGHWAHMVIHGMLHLQGYDHLTDDEADIMETLEIALLKELGFSNPYESEETEQDS